MSKQQIKIFNCCGSPIPMEASINNFIKNKNILNICQSESLIEDAHFLTITILYEYK